MEKHLQIHTIYNKEDRLNTVLDTIKNTKDNILVNNLITKLKIGGSKFHTVFDKAIYNESTDSYNGVLKTSELYDEKDFSFPHGGAAFRPGRPGRRPRG